MSDRWTASDHDAAYEAFRIGERDVGVHVRRRLENAVDALEPRLRDAVTRAEAAEARVKELEGTRSWVSRAVIAESRVRELEAKLEQVREWAWKHSDSCSGIWGQLSSIMESP